jgi:cell division septation protein DedD
MLMALLLLFAVMGCSDEQKEEAARLEQELLDTGTAAVDTAAPAIESTEMEAVVEEPEEVIPDMPARPTGEGYTVQVASCEDETYAQHLVELYTNRGYEPYVTTITHYDQLYYRVRLGNFETWSEASELKASLVDKYSVQAWIDQTEN